MSGPISERFQYLARAAHYEKVMDGFIRRSCGQRQSHRRDDTDVKEKGKQMKRPLALFCAAAVTVTTLGASATGAAATSLALPLGQAAQGQFQEVQYRGNQQRRAQQDNRRQVQQRSTQRRGFYRQGNHGFYNGHRGYNQRRAGYRYHSGFWFPPAAFVMGAIVGGAVANPPRAV